ncbi:uncharacterized protein LOC143803794 [Ranitomeya variabilis]|uniref:uncharacterized protein LOC143803794 n=1 Tax=Ranitomeya variabilis TaxID=490064 RepID=UPI004057610D
MKLGCSCPTASVLLAGACVLFSLHNAGAQTTNSTVPVPGWGIALLVMMSIMAAFVLVSMIFIPLWCRNTEDDCQDGISFYSPHGLCRPRNNWTIQCGDKPVQCQD